jgi:hypothetical protein
VNVPERQFDPVEALDQFVAINGLVLDLGDQNYRIGESTEIDDAGFQKLLIEDISSEQQDTLGNLSELTTKAPYELLADESLQTERILGALGVQRQADQAQILSGIRAEIDTLYDEAGRPWPVPYVLRNQSSEASMTPEDLIANSEYLDQIPVKPTLNASAHQRIASLRERHIDAPEASIYITLYLGEHQNEVVTVENLAAFLYFQDVLEQVDTNIMRSKITTLLGPKVQGMRIRGMLLENGLALQYGWRRMRREDGSMTQKQRIYRAVQSDSYGAAHPEITERHEDIVEFAPAPDATTSPDTTRQPAEPNYAEQTAQAETTLTPNPTETGSEKSDWKRDFKHAVGRAIEELAPQGLVRDGTMTAYAASLLGDSKKMGTETAVTRLINVGIVSRPGNVKLGWVELDASQIVAMHILNSNRDILGLNNRIRQRQAIKILRESVNSYLDKQRGQE